MPYKKRKNYRKTKPRPKVKRTRLQKLIGDSATAPITARSVAGAAYTALRLANKIRGVINVEKKYKDDNIIDTNVTNVRSLTVLNAMPKGDNHDQREGDSMLMQSVRVKGIMYKDPDVTHNQVKLLFLVDKESKGLLPDANDIWQTGASSSLIALRNRDYTDRFVIIKELNYTLTNDRPCIIMDDFVKLGVHTKYLKDQNTGYINDISDNALYMVMMSDSGTDGPRVYLSTRLTFTDN